MLFNFTAVQTLKLAIPTLLIKLFYFCYLMLDYHNIIKILSKTLSIVGLLPDYVNK